MARCAVFVLWLFSAPAFAAELVTLVWDGVAPSLKIAVGIERVIKFENTKIQVGVPIEHMGVVSAESNNGVVYLRCSAPFDKTRYRFREKDSGNLFLVDLTCERGLGPLAPVAIVSPDSEENSLAGPPITGQVPRSTVPELPPEIVPPVQYGITTLIRYAMQEVYAPSRLVDHKPDIHRLSFDDSAAPLTIVPGVRVRSRVLGQWRNERLYITAIYLQNLTSQRVDLDPRYLSGRHTWKAAALMNDELTPANTFGDATTLVTVSNRKWTEEARWLR